MLNQKKNEINWTFEEEFLFFEAHTFLGNKWKRYSEMSSRSFLIILSVSLAIYIFI